jgi:hypothetical protein
MNSDGKDKKSYKITTASNPQETTINKDINKNSLNKLNTSQQIQNREFKGIDRKYGVSV